MYLSDFITRDGELFFVSADLRSRKITIERVSNETFEILTRILTTDGTLDRDAGKTEVSA